MLLYFGRASHRFKVQSGSTPWKTTSSHFATHTANNTCIYFPGCPMTQHRESVQRTLDLPKDKKSICTCIYIVRTYVYTCTKKIRLSLPVFNNACTKCSAKLLSIFIIVENTVLKIHIHVIIHLQYTCIYTCTCMCSCIRTCKYVRTCTVHVHVHVCTHGISEVVESHKALECGSDNGTATCQTLPVCKN